MKLYARIFVLAHAAFRAAHMAHLVGQGACPPYPVLWDADRQLCFVFEPTGSPDHADYKKFQPELVSWESGLKMMNCEWRHYLHVRLPSESYDLWRGDPEAKPDQLTQWAITAPTGEEVASMAKLGHSHGAVKTRTTTSPVQRWMVDSGCSNDLIDQPSAKNLPKIKSPCPMVFETANGNVSAKTECPIFVAEINTTISPYVLECTPDVLSLGRRFVDEGFAFHWVRTRHGQLGLYQTATSLH